MTLDIGGFHYTVSCMEHRRQAVELIRNTERGLQDLVVAAAQAGDYESVVAITVLAREVAGIAARPSQAGAHASTTAIAAPRSVTATRLKRVGRKKKRRSSSRPSAYPKFFRQGDELVKVGWSKREKQEYVHKASRHVLGLLADAVTNVGLNGTLFDTDGLLPLNDPLNKADVPAYQAYLCLAWLRDAGAIVQHGRQGYTIPGDGHFKTAVDRYWGQLPIRRI